MKRKYLIAKLAVSISLIFTIVSCQRDTIASEYNENINLNIGDKVLLPNDDHLILENVVDNTCCCLCNCILPGYYTFYFKAQIANESYDFTWNSDSIIAPTTLPFEDFKIEFIQSLPEDNCDEKIVINKYVFIIKLIK